MSKTSFVQKISLVAGSLVFTVLLLEAGLRIGGFFFLQWQEHANRKKIYEDNKVRIMCVGESTTGLGGEDSYPSQLERILNQEYPEGHFRVINKGIPMTNTSVINHNIGNWIAEYTPDIVVLMMGVNDHNALIPVDLLSSQKFSFLKSLRVYKLYRWLRNNIIGRPFFPEEPKPKTFPKAQLYEIVHEKRKLFDLMKRAYDTKDRDLAERIWKRIQKSSRGIPDYEDIYGKYGELILYYHWYDHLPEVIDYFFNRNHQHEWIYEHVLPRFHEPQIKYLVLSYINKRISNEPRNWKLYQLLGVCFATLEENDRAMEAFQQQKILQRGAVGPITQRNYVEVLGKLKQAGIPVILVQYPRREVEALKMTLQDYVDVDMLRFVDNEDSFDFVVKRDGYDVYFTDRFGGNFGHCTLKGNRLLASNVARAVMRLMGDEGRKDN